MADNEEKLAGSAIPKRTIRLKPANPAAPAAAASATTLKLKTPTASAPAEAPAPAAAPVSTDTAKLARRTIKLVPQSGSPLSGPATAPATPVTPAVTPAPAAAPVSTDTAKLSKRTIKLTPASGTPGAAAASAPSAPTIKLHSPAAASAPSAPTIKLTNPQPAAAESEVPTDTAQITRQPAAPSSSGMGATVKLRPQSQQTIRLTPSAGGLQLKKPVEKTGLAAAEAPKELTNKLEQEKVAEKSPAAMMYLISSVVALLIIGFTCFIMYAQYSNFFSGTDINVPGLTRQTSSTNGN